MFFWQIIVHKGEELLFLEKIRAIYKQLIGFIYNRIITKDEEFYYDERNP